MTDPTPDTVAELLNELETATDEDRDDTLCRFACTAWPSLQAQNN